MDWGRQIITSRPVAAAGLAMITFGLIVGIRQFGWLQGLELAVYDFHLKLRTQKIVSESPIVLVRIYEQDIQRFGYPITDEVLAQTLAMLAKLNPRAIGVDLFRDLPAEGRKKLHDVVQKNDSIVMIEKRLGDPISPPEFIDNPTQIGFADLKQDPSGITRRGLLMLWDDNGQAHFSFALQLALQYLEDFNITLEPDPANADRLRLGNHPVGRFAGNDGGYKHADDGGYQILLHYQRFRSAFPSFTLSQILNGELKEDDISGRLVILGVTSPGVHDLHETPFSSGWSVAAPMYGLEIHAHMVDQLIDTALNGEAPLETLREWQEITLVLAWAVIGGILGCRLQRAPLLVLVTIIGPVLVFGLAHYAFSSGLWLPVVPVALSYIGALGLVIAYVLQKERAERELVMQLFGKFVAPQVATLLWEQRTQFMEQGRPRPQRLTATVLITDLQGYTSPAEAMDPADVMHWINCYMDAMTRIAASHGGIVDDYAGDGLKVNFGVPLPRQNEKDIDKDARCAVDCALEMGQELGRLNAQLSEQGLNSIRLRAGIVTGAVVAGSLGSSQRMKYTTVGDTVNSAARLESFDKEAFKKETDSAFRVLIGESTRQRLGPSYSVACIGSHFLPGKNKKITLYRVRGKGDNESATGWRK